MRPGDYGYKLNQQPRIWDFFRCNEHISLAQPLHLPVGTIAYTYRDDRKLLGSLIVSCSRKIGSLAFCFGWPPFLSTLLRSLFKWAGRTCAIHFPSASRCSPGTLAPQPLRGRAGRKIQTLRRPASEVDFLAFYSLSVLRRVSQRLGLLGFASCNHVN